MAQLGARYAAALFELATESGSPELFRDQAILLRDSLSDTECRRLIEHPLISATRKTEFLDSVFKGNIHIDLLSFLHIAIFKNREEFIVPGLALFIKRMDEHFGNVQANITSASALSGSQIAALRTMLSRKLGKQVEVTVRVDPSLIGGFSVHADGYFIDRTIKKRLSDMKLSLKRGAISDSQA